MRWFLTVFTVIWLSYASSQAFAIETGDTIPALALVNPQSSPINDEFNGNIVYLDFWASWCGPCKKSLPWMEELRGKFRDKRFKIITINLDTEKEEALKMIESSAFHQPVYFDPAGSAAEAFGLTVMPSSYLIADGKVKRVFKGFNESEKTKIEEEIKLFLERR